MTIAQDVVREIDAMNAPPKRVRDLVTPKIKGTYHAIYKAVRTMLRKGQLIQLSSGEIYTPQRLVLERPELARLLEFDEERLTELRVYKAAQAAKAAERKAKREAKQPRGPRSKTKACQCAGVPWRREKPNCLGKCGLPYEDEPRSDAFPRGASSMSMFEGR